MLLLNMCCLQDNVTDRPWGLMHPYKQEYAQTFNWVFPHFHSQYGVSIKRKAKWPFKFFKLLRPKFPVTVINQRITT